MFYMLTIWDETLNMLGNCNGLIVDVAKFSPFYMILFFLSVLYIPMSVLFLLNLWTWPLPAFLPMLSFIVLFYAFSHSYFSQLIIFLKSLSQAYITVLYPKLVLWIRDTLEKIYSLISFPYLHKSSILHKNKLCHKAPLQYFAHLIFGQLI